MDFERHQNLHTIIMLKDVLRKWWNAELSFADRDGVVQPWQRGEITPPANDFCRLSLFSREGLRRCSQSVRVLHEKFRASPKLRRALTHECHLGFTIVGAPLYVNNEYEGFVFVEGFLRQALGDRDLELLRSRLGELNGVGTLDLQRARERIPLMNEREFEKLTDLLEFAVTDICNYEAELAKKDAAVKSLSHELSDRYRFENIVGRSGPMLEIFRLLEKVANSDSTVLINGESGTGKELVARAIHYNGPRRDKPFVVQNCSAFNDNLLESALFGHTKGSFTGAVRDKKGLFEAADEGTFFLDEVGDMSPTLQVKLLRVLQEGTFLPVGSTQPREVDVRVIAATHKDLGELVKRGEFREDLFYRINVIRVQVPALRERKDDLPVLIDHFLRKHHREGQRARGLAPDALALLAAYGWPGNIRELENEIERLLVLGSDLETIPAELVSSRIRDAVLPGAVPFLAQARINGRLNDAVEQLERELIQQGLLRTSHNKSRLARELGISRSNLILKIAKYGLGPAGGGSDSGAEEAEA
ncbi:sigma-54-dependent Fis family transcriptional regulator [Aggregicoccus sp. 17bor-14]|uniref:sigma 54-interacting transcriptional regulator n=1 Tax=Myxococcaceae TaxID=31 RepID=UPI00129D0784|nr:MULTISPECIES: sigma 54-interacting transcriptional regulator [Myxococcaceae]MBF5044020.1 sigma 54-interacting transcriptional regulator [Simulacricoccus sp. 17bor-14]MRI89771.1 sigma-54-dependent Fis family transcriptional regulator [Aggregicoccus sp. 17bor-14]